MEFKRTISLKCIRETWYADKYSTENNLFDLDQKLKRKKFSHTKFCTDGCMSAYRENKITEKKSSVFLWHVYSYKAYSSKRTGQEQHLLKECGQHSNECQLLCGTLLNIGVCYRLQYTKFCMSFLQKSQIGR